jgi:hypothetical protein
MYDRLLANRKLRQRVSIGISAQEQRLENEHRAVPNVSSTTKQRQGQAGNERLY